MDASSSDSEELVSPPAIISLQEVVAALEVVSRVELIALKEIVVPEVVVSLVEFVESVLVADNHVKVPRDHASVQLFKHWIIKQLPVNHVNTQQN